MSAKNQTYKDIVLWYCLAPSSHRKQASALPSLDYEVCDSSTLVSGSTTCFHRLCSLSLSNHIYVQNICACVELQCFSNAKHVAVQCAALYICRSL